MYEIAKFIVYKFTVNCIQQVVATYKFTSL